MRVKKKIFNLILANLYGVATTSTQANSFEITNVFLVFQADGCPTIHGKSKEGSSFEFAVKQLCVPWRAGPFTLLLDLVAYAG